MTERNKPLSPHLQIYRLPMLALLSITHRITGVCLSLGMVVLPLLLLSIASGPESYACAAAHVGAWYGQVFLFLFSVGLVFHLLNGVRHLFWDFGLNLQVASAEASGYAVLILTLVLVTTIWLVACFL